MEIYERDSQALTQCYFCGEELIPSQLELHVKHCGLVLEPCPDNCGLYVQRQYKNHHANWCKKDPHHLTKSMERDLKTLKMDVDTMRTNLEVESNLRHQQQADWAYQISKFNLRFQRVEDLNNKVINALQSFKKLISEEREARIKDFNEIKANLIDVCKLASQLKFTLSQTKMDISDMKNTYNLPEKDNKFYENFEAWKSRQEILVASLKLKIDKDLNEEIYKLHQASITRSKSVSDLLDLNEIIIDEQDKYTEQIKAWQMEIERFKTFLNEENVMISGIWRDQLDEITKLKCTIESYETSIKQLHEEQSQIKSKLAKLEENETHSGKDSVDIIHDLLEEGIEIKKRISELEKTLKRNKIVDDIKTEILDISNTHEELKNRLTDVENILKGNSATVKLTKSPSDKVSHRDKDDVKYYKEHRLESRCQPSEQTHSGGRPPDVERTRQIDRLKVSTSVSAFENGRVTWAIPNFSENMRMAKESEDELQGPIFYNNEFGYKFQLKACLNGIGQWKGRHMIIALHILQSEWDGLLKWPCRIHVVICLVDQVAISRKAKDIVKSFTSSPITRNADYKCLQMFIPHRTLTEHSYIKDDTLVLKVKLKVISI